MPLTSYFLFMSNCIKRAILKLVEDLESGVYINVNEHFKGKRNIEITLLYGFTSARPPKAYPSNAGYSYPQPTR